MKRPKKHGHSPLMPRPQKAKKPSRQRVTIIIKDVDGSGDGDPIVDWDATPSLDDRTTNSAALNLGLRVKAIIEKHWKTLSAPLPSPENKSQIILPPGFTGNVTLDGHIRT